MIDIIIIIITSTTSIISVITIHSFIHSENYTPPLQEAYSEAFPAQPNCYTTINMASMSSAFVPDCFLKFVQSGICLTILSCVQTVTVIDSATGTTARGFLMSFTFLASFLLMINDPVFGIPHLYLRG